MESGNREYLDDGWAMLEEDISRVRDKLLHLLHIGQQTELRECLVDPAQPVRHVVKRLEGRAASLSIALQFQDAADSDPIPLDAERLEGCLLNLVGNALEAFPRAGGCVPRPAEVRVEIARTPDALIYDVRDNGTGAERGSRRTASGRFVYDQKRWYRVRTARNAQALWKWAAGSCGRTCPTAERCSASCCRCAWSAPRCRRGEPPQGGLMKETILLVDDEQGIRTVMGLSLRDAGYNVITVASGRKPCSFSRNGPSPS